MVVTVRTLAQEYVDTLDPTCPVEDMVQNLLYDLSYNDWGTVTSLDPLTEEQVDYLRSKFEEYTDNA